MDAFYASVEQRDRPELKGKPIAVGGRPETRGVVAAASYEARAFGVRSAMSMSKALRICPTLHVVQPEFSKYRAVSSQVFSIFRTVTPLVEPLSLDEAYLDVTENKWREPLATKIAKTLKTQILEETNLTASAGVAPNKFLAKIASSWRKPDGLTVVPHQRIEAFLQKLPVESLWGVGPITAEKLRNVGITRLTEVRSMADRDLRKIVGNQTVRLKLLSRGIDDRPVVPRRTVKSHSAERTYANDLTDLISIRTEIERMAKANADWLSNKKMHARTVTVKVRYHDFTTVTRRNTESSSNFSRDALVRRALLLLDRTDITEKPVRLLGVGVHGLTTQSEQQVANRHPVLWDSPTDA